MSAGRRRALLLGVLGLAVVAWGLSRPGFWRRVRAARPSLPTVVLFVMDTVRADRLSICGYGRPTSPTLERLVAEGADYTCQGVAPGSWTLPSHATWFTGQMPWEHRADFAGDGEQLPDLDLKVRPLREGAPTLAEEMVASGRAAVLVAANPVLGPASGLARGFQLVSVAHGVDELRGGAVAEKVAEALRDPGVRARRGLFLVVNVVDAHNPLAEVPAGQGWIRPRPPTIHNPVSDPDDILRRYVQGRLDPAEAGAHLAALSDSYDWGVHVEDRTLGVVLRVLRGQGWDAAGLRVVVVADHGEMLGEHGALDHGPYLYEGTQRVPLLTMGIDGRLPRGVPVSTAVVHDLLRDGRVPAELPEASAVAAPSELWVRWSAGRVGTATQVARWQGSEKVVSRDGQASRYDLAADPGEERPAPLPEAEVPPSVRGIEAALAVTPTGDVLSPELIEALKKAGYLE